MVWLKRNWRWAVLNLVALSILTYILRQGTLIWNSFDPGLESGKWAVRFLLFCLAMTPLRIYFGWRSAVKLRKTAGLYSFGFALVHIWFFINEIKYNWLSWFTWPWQPFITLGLVSLLILTALAITSNRWAMRRLRKNWKRLHRLVYVAGLTVIFHALLTIGASKKMLGEPYAKVELTLYLVILVVLLLVRLPIIQRWGKRLQKPHRIIQGRNA